jgi:steroid delta-isomerase-like uncharacterized protein
MSQENIASSRRLLEETFNRGNFSVIDELSTEDFVGHDPLMGDEDKEASKQAISGYRDAFPDLHATIEDIFAAGDKVVYRWSVEGTFENEIMGLQPTGERGSPVRGITIDRFEGDKIAESWSQWDTLTFMRDIGAIPSEAAASAGS